MKNIWKKILCVLLILVMGVEAGPTYQVMAASKLTGSQKKEYRKCLTNYFKNRDNWRYFLDDDMYSLSDIKKNTVFALEDVNFDGKKDLLIRTEINARNQNGTLYRSNAKNSKAKEYPLGEGNGVVSEISKKGFKVDFAGTTAGNWTETYYTATASGTIVECASVWHGSLGDEYSVKGKHASKTQFNKAVKKLGTFKKIKYHKYSDGNLKKYL